MELVPMAIGSVIGLIIGAGIMLFLANRKNAEGQTKADQIVEKGRQEAEKLLVDAKEEILQDRKEAKKEEQKSRNDLRDLERRLQKKEDVVERRVETLETKENQLELRDAELIKQRDELDERSQELKKMIEEEQRILQKTSGLSKEEATEMFLTRIEPELDHEIEGLIKKRQERARDEADDDARKVLGLAIQRVAANHCTETTVSIVDLPSEDMKGRIIGREGQNIRAFEKTTGIDVIVDDTPGVILLSGFDPVRRETARMAMEKLISDGRIHPTRIEEVMDQCRKEMDERLVEIGKKTCFELEIHGLAPKITTLLGRLQFRTSYGQNVLQHSVEVAEVSATIASELGLDTQLAKRCGLLHDIGKAVDQHVEGTHPEIGAELLKRFGEGTEVVDAARNHHEEADADFMYTVIVAAADAVSASRPGARGESMENYIKRLHQLEAIATSQNGVEAAYAVQAGRELRVLVNAQKVDDKSASIMARDIAKNIEAEMTYPGEIKVTVMRETRVVEYAR
jgi:ribonuclease Y